MLYWRNPLFDLGRSHMISGVLDMQRHICLGALQIIRRCIGDVHGVSYPCLMCICGIALLEHALTLIYTSLHAHAYRPGILSANSCKAWVA